jgi:predicted Rossmann fold flavoprotein
MNAEVNKIEISNNSFSLQFSRTASPHEALAPDFICIATGGYPKSSMFDWLKQLGHSIEEPVPSLFTFNTPSHSITQLMGVSIPNARVKILNSKLEQQGPLLITHWGLSGPAVLKLSAWGARELEERNWEFATRINWIPKYDEHSLKEKLQSLRFEFASQKIYSKNPFGLPQRLWEFLLSEAEIKPQSNWADLPAKLQNKMINNLVAYEMHIKGKTTFKEEFVTAGGIRLSEIDPNTMMSKKIPNLFFAGEVMDVDGVTGGFNFQHAWTSGFIAGKHIASMGI